MYGERGNFIAAARSGEGGHGKEIRGTRGKPLNHRSDRAKQANTDAVGRERKRKTAGGSVTAYEMGSKQVMLGVIPPDGDQ